MAPLKMAVREVDEFSSILGEIKARLSVIEKQQIEERTKSDQHRSDLRIVIAAQSTSMQDLANKVTSFNDRIVLTEGLTSDYREQRDIARGAAKMIGF